MSVRYEDNEPVIPERQTRRRWMLQVFRDRFGSWVSNVELEELAQAAGFGSVGQLTGGRMSELRDELIAEDLGIFSECLDKRTGKWRYKLDHITREYRRAYLDRKEVSPLPMYVSDWIDMAAELGEIDVAQLEDAPLATFQALASQFEQELLGHPAAREIALKSFKAVLS